MARPQPSRCRRRVPHPTRGVDIVAAAAVAAAAATVAVAFVSAACSAGFAVTAANIAAAPVRPWRWAATAAVAPPPLPRLLPRRRPLQGEGEARSRGGSARRTVMRAARTGSGRQFMNAWAVLNLPPDSSKQDIRKRYRQLVATEHPDKKPGDPTAPERFQKINDAYQALMSDSRRAFLDFEDIRAGAAPKYQATDFVNKYSNAAQSSAKSRWQAGERMAGFRNEPKKEVGIVDLIIVASGMITVVAVLWNFTLTPLCAALDIWVCYE